MHLYTSFSVQSLPDILKLSKSPSVADYFTELLFSLSLQTSLKKV